MTEETPKNEPPTPELPRMTRKEWLWLAFFVILVVVMIWLSTSDVWGRWFSVEEIQPDPS